MINTNIHDAGVLRLDPPTKNSSRNSTRNTRNSRKNSTTKTTNAQEFLRRIDMLKKGGSKTLKKRSGNKRN